MGGCDELKNGNGWKFATAIAVSITLGGAAGVIRGDFLANREVERLARRHDRELSQLENRLTRQHVNMVESANQKEERLYQRLTELEAKIDRLLARHGLQQP